MNNEEKQSEENKEENGTDQPIVPTNPTETNEVSKEIKSGPGLLDKLKDLKESITGKSDEQEFSLEDEKEIVDVTDNKDLKEAIDIAEEKKEALKAAVANGDLKENKVDDIEVTDEKEITGKADTFFENPEHKEEALQEEPLLECIYRNRLNIDKAMRRVETMYGEKSDVWKSLFTAKAWLGKLLGQLETVNPYITDKPIKSASEIPKTADVYDNPVEMQKFSLETILEKVLMVRGDIHNLTNEVAEINLTKQELKNGRLAAIAITNSYINLCEANFELRYQLSVIKKG